MAHGEPVEDGHDGYYNFGFDCKPNKKPVIRDDGSVDYWSVHAIETVDEGQVIATYVEPVPGKNGMTVKGTPVTAKRGRPIPPLLGRGFERSEDGLTYKATISGKIEMQNNRILIVPVYEIFGDVDVNTGNIDFNGDVVIHGNIKPGASVRSTASITVDGISEGCNLEAGKDIILRGGMIGGDKAHLKVKGNLYAKFIEYTVIQVEGDMEADVLLDCTVACRGSILIQGRTAKIIGGDVSAVKGIRATTIGNEAEMRTAVSVGVDTDCMARLNLLKKKLEITKMEIDKIEQGLAKFEEMEKERGVSYREDPRRVALLRTRIQNMATLAGDEGEVKRLEHMISDGANATVCVTRDVFPGVSIAIRDQILNVKNNAKCVEFYHLNGKICTRTAED